MKIIINDWQYLIFEGLITEEKYQNAIKKLKVGDKIEYIDGNNDKLTFDVIFNDSGQIYLKNTDNGVYKNNYFFITISDLINNNLSFKTINTIKNLPANVKNEKDDSIKLAELLKNFPTSSWKRSTFKNISKLNMGGEDIDMEKPDAEDEKFKDYVKVSDVSPFLEELKGLKPDNTYRLTLSNGGLINLKLIDNNSDSLFFECLSLKGPAKSYTDLINAQLMLDIDAKNVQQKVSSITANENVDSVYYITFKKIIGGEGNDGNTSNKNILIKNIIDLDLVQDDGNNDDETPTEIPHIEDMSDEDIDDMSPEDITNMVLSNPVFKSAFLSKPGFWKRLVGGKPKGIIAAKSILKKFNYYDSSRGDKKEKDLVVSFFKNNQQYLVQLMDKTFTKDDIVLDIKKTYLVKAKKRTNVKGGITVFLYGNGFMFKINSIYGESRDEFRATLIINYNTEDEYRENRTIKITDAY